MPALFASDAQKAMNRNATTKVSLELVKHEGGQFAAARFQIREERRPVFLYRSVKQGGFGAMARVRARTDGRVGVTACRWLRGKHQQEFSATRRYLLLAVGRRRFSSALRGQETAACCTALLRVVPYVRAIVIGSWYQL
jgi:hypothetical protein